MPSDAPALVLAVPGRAGEAAGRLADEIAESARRSCPGVDVRVGFVDGDVRTLAEALVFEPGSGSDYDLRGVVVPALLGPHPQHDAAIDRAAAKASVPIMMAAHLGPHPLLAEALHARLAEAGLARTSRARGMSVVGSLSGVLVLADRGEEAVQAAGVSAVLLAARLAVPVTPASLGDPDGLEDALMRLREAGAPQPVISPCVIGPETRPAEVRAVQAVVSGPVAPPLGAHPAVGQLAAIRYGAALTRVAMSQSAG